MKPSHDISRDIITNESLDEAEKDVMGTPYFHGVVEDKIKNGGVSHVDSVIRMRLLTLPKTSSSEYRLSDFAAASSASSSLCFAMIIELDRAIRCGNDSGESVYNDRGIIFF